MSSHPEPDWEKAPEWRELMSLIREAQATHRYRHPGIITEAIVTAIAERFILASREIPFRERRKNHPERIRRLAHAVYRTLDHRDEQAAAAIIAAQVLKTFTLTPHGSPGGSGEGW